MQKQLQMKWHINGPIGIKPTSWILKAGHQCWILPRGCRQISWNSIVSGSRLFSTTITDWGRNHCNSSFHWLLHGLMYGAFWQIICNAQTTCIQYWKAKPIWCLQSIELLFKSIFATIQKLTLIMRPKHASPSNQCFVWKHPGLKRVRHTLNPSKNGYRRKTPNSKFFDSSSILPNFDVKQTHNIFDMGKSYDRVIPPFSREVPPLSREIPPLIFHDDWHHAWCHAWCLMNLTMHTLWISSCMMKVIMHKLWISSCMMNDIMHKLSFMHDEWHSTWWMTSGINMVDENMIGDITHIYNAYATSCMMIVHPMHKQFKILMFITDEWTASCMMKTTMNITFSKGHIHQSYISHEDNHTLYLITAWVIWRISPFWRNFTPKTKWSLVLATTSCIHGWNCYMLIPQLSIWGSFGWIG